MRSSRPTCKLINMNLTKAQRDLIIEALKNDSRTINDASLQVQGSARTILAGQANERVSLAATLEGAYAFEYSEDRT